MERKSHAQTDARATPRPTSRRERMISLSSWLARHCFALTALAGSALVLATAAWPARPVGGLIQRLDDLHLILAAVMMAMCLAHLVEQRCRKGKSLESSAVDMQSGLDAVEWPEESSRLRLKQHEALLREIPEPIHIVDATGNVIFWNHGAERLYGFPASEAIGQSAHDLLKINPPEGDTLHARGDPEADRWIGQLDATTKSGTAVRIERRRTRVFDGDESIGEVVFDLDLQEHAQLLRVERRRQRLQSLGTLASGIAHDLNNLLTPILMGARMLQRGGDKLDREAMLETIVVSANRGSEIISQLLTFARGGEGQHVPVDLSELVAEVTGILRHTLKDNIILEISVEDGLPLVSADPTEFSQVLMNLTVNARDAMPAGGTLKLSVQSVTLASERTYSLVTLPPGDYVAIGVSDTGVGIPQDIRDRIFDPFFSTKERGQGTGLGLSTSLGIIRSHGGAFDVRSSVGRGTTITILLPVISSTSEESAE